MDHLINALQQYMGVWQLSQLGIIRQVADSWHWSGLVDQDGQYRVLPPFLDDSDLHHTQWIDDALHTDKFIQLSDDHSQLLYRSPLEKTAGSGFRLKTNLVTPNNGSSNTAPASIC